MNVFRIIRRCLWAIILAACIIWGGIYLALQQTLLTSDGLNHIIMQSRVAETVRQDILLPRVLASTRSSDYSKLLDDKTVTDAFNQAIPTEKLNAKLTPATESLALWLNSKEPAIHFTIDMSDLSTDFANELSRKIDQKIATLPRCTTKNTLADVESGVCRSPIVSQEALTTKINQAIKSDAQLKESSTITPESVPVSDAMHYRGTDVPSYLNIFYGTSIIAAGLAVMVTLWLLFKHRLAGIITIGGACILAASGLFVSTVVLSHFTVGLTNDELVSKVVFAAAQSLVTVLQNQAIGLVIGGSIAAIAGILLLFILARRRKSRQTIHMSSTKQV